MLNKYITKLALYLIRGTRLEGQDKMQIMTALLDNVGALPFQKLITFDLDGTILIGGKKITMEQAIALKESARGLNKSFARRIINEQVKYAAISFGVHEGLNNEQMMFAKAALWLIEQENNLIDKIVGSESVDN